MDTKLESSTSAYKHCISNPHMMILIPEVSFYGMAK